MIDLFSFRESSCFEFQLKKKFECWENGQPSEKWMPICRLPQEVCVIKIEQQVGIPVISKVNGSTGLSKCVGFYKVNIGQRTSNIAT